MIILLHGPDDYRREVKKKKIIQEFCLKNSPTGLRYFNLEEDAPGVVLEFMAQESLFETKKLAVLGGVAGRGELAQTVAPFFQSPDLNVLISERELGRETLSALRPALKENFGYLSGKEWQNFTHKVAQKYSLRLSLAALRFLAALYEKDTWRLVTEVQKLSLLQKPVLDLPDLEKLNMELTPNYWATMQGLRSGYLAPRLRSLEVLFAQNEPPSKIFNILSSFYSEKLPQFADYDLKVKSGKLDYEEALLALALG